MCAMRSVFGFSGLSALALFGLSACSGNEASDSEQSPDSSLSGGDLNATQTMQPTNNSNGGDDNFANNSSENNGDSTAQQRTQQAAQDDTLDGDNVDDDSVNEGNSGSMTLVGNDAQDSSGAQGGGPGNTDDVGEATDSAPQFQPAPASVCPEGPFAESPLTAQSVPQIVCSNMNFIEGAVWFSELDTLFFSDISFGGGNTGTIYSFAPGGQCEAFIENAGTNGLAIAPDGNLLSCRHGDGTLTVFDLETKEPTVFLGEFEGSSFVSPNDIVLRSDGNLYFTDPNYDLGPGSNLPVRAYRQDTEGNVTVIDQGGNANGINLSPDESKLYLSHLGGGANDILVFDLDASGAPSNQATFLNIGSDGMTVDCAGNLYITQNGVQIYSPEGDFLGTLNTPGAANVAFGGPDRRTLYVTGRDSLYAVEMAIPGMPY